MHVPLSLSFRPPRQSRSHQQVNYSGPSLNCGAFPPIWSQGAFEPTKICAAISTPGSPSIVPSVRPWTFLLFHPARVLPHELQKQRPQFSEVSKKVTLFSPLTHSKASDPTSA